MDLTEFLEETLRRSILNSGGGPSTSGQRELRRLIHWRKRKEERAKMAREVAIGLTFTGAAP